MSLDSCEPLMWAHYGNEHKGVCIGIDEKELEKVIDREDPKQGFVGDINVIYREAPNFDQLLNLYCKRVQNGKDVNPLHLLIDLIMNALRLKSEHWNYEQEVRLVRLTNGTLSLPISCIQEVIFGQRISPDDRESILNAIAKSRSSSIKVGDSFHKPNSFKMDVKWV